jgi:acetyl-CoA carboxylase carboxyl transferase subunit alpha
MRSYLDFEKPVAEIEARADELRGVAQSSGSAALADEIAKLQAKADASLKEIYGALTPWHKTMVARHPQRPHFKDYLDALVTEFTPLAGDRVFGEDEAIVGGFGRFRGQPDLRHRSGKRLRYQDPPEA